MERKGDSKNSILFETFRWDIEVMLQVVDNAFTLNVAHTRVKRRFVDWHHTYTQETYYSLTRGAAATLHSQ